jgi:hypothetical protein
MGDGLWLMRPASTARINHYPSPISGGVDMPLLIRRFKLTSGMMQEERIDDPDRIERYFKLFEKDDVKKLETGAKVFIEKDEWQLLP